MSAPASPDGRGTDTPEVSGDARPRETKHVTFPDTRQKSKKRLAAVFSASGRDRGKQGVHWLDSGSVDSGTLGQRPLLDPVVDIEWGGALPAAQDEHAPSHGR